MAELIEELVFVFRGQDGGLTQALKSQETELKRLKTVAQEITKELKSAQNASKALQDGNGGDGASQLTQVLKAAEQQAAKSAQEVERLQALIASTSPLPPTSQASPTFTPTGTSQSTEAGASSDAISSMEEELTALLDGLAFDEVADALTQSLQAGFDSIRGGGLSGILLAPLQVFGSLAQNLLGGAAFGVAQKFSDNFGKGLLNQVEAELSPFIGSTELAGEAAAVALAKGFQAALGLVPDQFKEAFGSVQNIIDGVSDDVLRSRLSDVLSTVSGFRDDVFEGIGGQQRINQAGLATRAGLAGEGEQQLRAAQQQAQKEVAETRKSFDDFGRGASVDLGQVREQLASTRASIQDLTGLEQQLRAQIDQAEAGTAEAQAYQVELGELLQARDRQTVRVTSLEKLLKQDPKTLAILDGLIKEQQGVVAAQTAELEAAQARMADVEGQTFADEGDRITAVSAAELDVQRLVNLRENEREALNRLVNLAAGSSQGGAQEEIRRLEQTIVEAQQRIDQSTSLLSRNEAGEIIAIDTDADIQRREVQFSLLERLGKLRAEGDREFLEGADSTDNAGEIARLEEQLAAVNQLLARDQVAELGSTISASEQAISQSTERIEELRRIQAERDKRLADLRAQTVAANAALQSVNPPSDAVPEPVRKIAAKLSELTGQSVRDEQLPDLAIADEFLSAQGSNSRYQASLNRILVTQELFDSIQNGTLSSEQAYILSEELASAFAGDFGSFDGTNRIASGQVNRDELQKLRDSVQGSSQILEELSRYPEDVRELEEYTKLLALKAVQDIQQNDADQSLRTFAQDATGALAKTEATVTAQRALLDSVERIATEQGIEVGDLVTGLRSVIDGVVKASQDVRGAIASNLDAGTLDAGGQSAISQQLAAIQQATAAVTGQIQSQAAAFQALDSNAGSAINLDGLRNVVGDDLVNKVTDALDLQKRLNQTLTDLAQTPAGQNVTEAKAQVEERLAQVSNFFQTVNRAIAKAALNQDGEIKNAQIRAIGDLVTDRFDVLASEADRVNNAVVSRLQSLANSVTTRVGERVGAVRDGATQAVGGAAQRVTGAVGGAVSAATAPAREVIDAQLANLSSTVEAQKDKAIAYLNKTIGETLTEEVLELVNVQGRLNASLEQLSGLGDSDQAEKARKLINEKLGEASDLLLSTTRAIGDFVANADGDSIRGNVDSLRASIRDRFDGFREAIDGTQNTIEASIRQLQEQAEAALAPRSFGQRVQQVAGGAVATVRGAVGAGRATVQAGQTVAAATKEVVQSDRGQGVIQVIGNTAKALISVGQTGYKVAKAFESVALDVIPFGNAIKTVTQQVVLPAAGAVAVAQFIPGADQILPTIQAGAASVINPLIQGGVADLTAQASGVISALPGFVQGAATQGVAQIASGIGSAVELITVNGATVAIAGGAAALAGRAGGVVAGRAGQQVAQGVQNFVTPQSTAPQVQATQSQEPQRQADAANAPLNAVVQSIKSLAERLDGSFDEASKQVENSLRAGATGLAAIQQRQSAVSEDAAVAQINGVLDQLRRVGADAQDIAAIEQERDRIVARQADLRASVSAATAEAAELGDIAGLDNLSDDIGEAFGRVLNATNKLLAEFAEVEAQARLLDTAKAAAGSPKVQGIAKDLAVNTVATGASVVASKAVGATGMNVAGLSADFTAALVARLGFGAAEAFREVLANVGDTAEFKAAGQLEKVGIVLRATADKLGTTADALGADLFGDISSFITGNVVAAGAGAAASAVPALGAIPLPGGIAATQVVPQLQKLRDRIQAWANASGDSLAADANAAGDIGEIVGLDNRAVDAIEKIPGSIYRFFDGLDESINFVEQVLGRTGHMADEALKLIEADLEQASQRLVRLSVRVDAGEFNGKEDQLVIELREAKGQFDQLQQAYVEASENLGKGIKNAPQPGRATPVPNAPATAPQRPVPTLNQLNNEGELFDVDGMFGRLNQIVSNFNDSLEKSYRQRFAVLGDDVAAAIADLDVEFQKAQAAGDNGRAIDIGNTRARLAENQQITGGIIEGDAISPQQIAQLDAAEKEIRRIYGLLDRPVPDNLGPDIAKQASVGVRALKGLGLALGGVFSAQGFVELGRRFTELLRGVLTDYAEFQEQIQLFGVVSGSLDTAAFDNATAKIKELGATTTKTAADAAEAAVELAKVGFSADAVAATLGTVIKVSEATSESILRSTEVVGATLNQFGLLSDNQEQLAINSQRVGDVLVTVANASATSIDSAGETFAYLAIEANNAGQSLEQTGALIALAANAGIKGSSAGTGLAEALRRLQLAAAASNTELQGLGSVAGRNAVGAFSQLGIEATDAAGNLRPLTELIPEIRAGLEDKTPGDKGLILKGLFGVQGGRAFNTLLSQSQESIDDILSQMENAGGSTDTAAAQLTQGFAGNLKLLNSAISEVRNDIGKVLSDALNPFIAGLTSLLEIVGKIPDPILKAGAGAAAFSIVMTGLTAAIAAYSLAQELGIISTLKKTVVTTKNTISNLANLQSNKSLAQANIISRVASTDLTTVLRQLTGERLRDTGAVLGNTAALKGNAAAQAGNAVAAGSGVKQLELFGNAAEAAGGAASVAGKKATGLGAGAKNLATSLKDLGGNAVGGVTKGLKGMAPALGVAVGGIKALVATAGPLVLAYAAVRTTVSLLGGAWLEMGKGARAANKAMEETQETLDELRESADDVATGDGLSEFERAAKDAETATGESLGGVIGLLDKLQQKVINFDGGEEEGVIGEIKRIGAEALKNLDPLTLFVNQVSKFGTIRGRAQKSNDIAADKLVSQTAEDLQGLFGVVEIDLAGSSAKKLQEQINSLDPEQLLSLEKGLTAIQSQTKSIDISRLDKGTGDLLKRTQGEVGKLSNLIRSATDEAGAVGETVDAIFVSGITDNLSEATEAISREETKRLTRIQKSLNDGTISNKEAEAQRLAVQKSSTEQRLKLEQDAQAVLARLLGQSLDAKNGINFTDEALTQIEPALEGVNAQILETESALADAQGGTLVQSASRRLEGISENVEDQLQVVTRGEQEKLLAIAQSEAAGTATTEEAAAERVKIANEAIEQQIKLEQGRVEKLKALSFADQESEDARIDALTAAEDKILQLQIQSVQNATEAKRAELERQVNDKVSAEDKAVEAAVKAEREAQLEIARLLDAGVITAEEAERRKTAASVAGVNARLAAENARLAALEGQGVQADVKVEKTRQEAISQSQDAIIGLIQERVDTQKRLEQEAVDALKKAQDEAIAELEAAEQERTLLLKERELQLRKAGGNTAEIERQLSEEALNSERAQLQERLRLQEEFVAKLERAQAETGVDNEDAIRDAKRETTTLSIALVDNEIAAQNQLTEKILANLDKEEAVRKRQSDAAIASIQRQQSLFDSRIAVANSLQSLEETRLRNAASLATSETTRASIEKQIAELQLSTLAKRQEAERVSLELAQRRAQLESQIEVAKARADVARAEAQGASPEELDALKQVLGLQIQAASDIGELQANERTVLRNNQLGEEDSAQTALTLANRGLADAIEKEKPASRVRTIRTRTIRSGGGKAETNEDRLNKDRDKEAQNARGRADAFDSTTERDKAISRVDLSKITAENTAETAVQVAGVREAIQEQTGRLETALEERLKPQQFFTGTFGQASTPVGETFSVAERGPELATDPRSGLTRLFNRQSYLRSDVPLVIRNAADTRKLLAQDGALNPSAISGWVQRQQQAAPSILSGQIASEQLGRVTIGSSHSPPGQSNGGVEVLRAMYQQNAELVRRMRSIQSDLAGNRANTQGAAVELTRVRREIQAKPTSLSGVDYRTGALR